MVAPYVENYATSLADHLVATRNPDLPQEANEILASEIRIFLYDRFATNQEIRNLRYRIYEKRFSEQELRELVAFHKSELGQKLNKALPEILNESAQSIVIVLESIDQELIENIGPRLNERMAEHGW
jgi:hypothetical protein